MKKYKLVLAGCGGMANTWVEYALKRDDVEIVAFVDIKMEAAGAMAERHGIACGYFTDISEAIQATGANLVFDVTIPEVHKTITVAALSLGCDVFGEKPMASSMEEAVEMVASARQSGKLYAVMQNRRFMKNIRAFRSLLSQGIIGRPGFMTANFYLGPHFGGFRDLMDSPLILDMAIHTFDQARFISGADPISVYCHEFNPAGSWFKGNAAAACIFEFSDGSVFTYNGSWCAQGASTSWESEWRVTGEKGTAIWDGSNSPYCEILNESSEHGSFNKRIEGELTWMGTEGHHGCLDEMFAALTEERNPETVCTDNIKSMSMVFGALESAKTGRKVRLI